MKRNVAIVVFDSADLPVAIRLHSGPAFPMRSLAAFDDPRTAAQRLGDESFGEGFSLIERLGSFDFDGETLIVYEGSALRFDARHANVGISVDTTGTTEHERFTSNQIERVLSLISDRLVRSAA